MFHFPRKIIPAKLSLIVTALLLVLSSCSENISQDSLSNDSKVEGASIPEPIDKNPERKLIQTGYLEFECPDLQARKATISEAINKYKAYISSDESSRSYDRITNTIVIRVPAPQFTRLLTATTDGIRKFDRSDVHLKDVTEEFLDVSARLKTKKELELRYLELLKKAESIKDMMEIEQQIADLRGDIESIEGRLKFLENQVSLSTLTILMYEKLEVNSEWSRRFSKAFGAGWENLILFFVFLTNLWPFLLILLLLLLGLRKLKKKAKKS